ncbi:MAG: GTPase Era [Hyphomonadaceae bacterium]|nr:GTPase Era [Hyphomonadaceae bacterium]
MSDPTPGGPTRCAIVAIVGAPNAGKSTLVNRLVGQKIAPVTHKAQTTRAPLRGVAMRGQAQLILVDTPGVFAPKRRLDRAMVRAAFASLEDADIIVHLVDAGSTYLKKDAERIEAKLQEAGRKAILALNKVDAVPRESLLALTRDFTAGDLYTDVFMISALTGSGVEDLASHLASKAPEGPWLFPPDQAADAPSRVLAAEVTREKLMLRLHEEVPYEATVETEAWEEKKDGSVRIEQTIFVARESQRRIAIGDKGQVVKAIGEAARKELEAMLDRRVHLFLHVKLRENWSEERARYAALGLDFDV